MERAPPDAAATVVVDARGHRCPMPTLKLRRALADAPPGSTVILLADDPMARIDVPHFAASSGCELLERQEDGAVLRFSLRRSA